MQANAFSRRWREVEAEVPGLGTSQSIPVMVMGEGGILFSTKSVMVESHEDGGHTVWIKVEEY